MIYLQCDEHSPLRAAVQQGEDSGGVGARTEGRESGSAKSSTNLDRVPKDMHLQSPCWNNFFDRTVSHTLPVKQETAVPSKKDFITHTEPQRN